MRQYDHMVTPAHPDRSQRFRVPEGADEKAANADSVTFITPPKSAIPTTRDVLRAGFITGVTASILCSVLAFIGWVFRVQFVVAYPFTSGDPFTSSIDLAPVPWVSFPLAPFLAGMVGSLAAAALLGVRRAGKLVLLLGTLIAAIAVVVVLLEPHGVTWPTRIWLILMIATAWLIIVPQVARVVGDSDPTITASFRDDVDTDL